jgi:hypothetical protein
MSRLGQEFSQLRAVGDTPGPSTLDYEGETVNIVNVRWWDGYLETFEATEVRAGCDLLWMRLSNGANRNIPLRGVRWWSTSIESHGTDTEKAGL